MPFSKKLVELAEEVTKLQLEQQQQEAAKQSSRRVLLPHGPVKLPVVGKPVAVIQPFGRRTVGRGYLRLMIGRGIGRGQGST